MDRCATTRGEGTFDNEKIKKFFGKKNNLKRKLTDDLDAQIDIPEHSTSQSPKKKGEKTKQPTEPGNEKVDVKKEESTD